MKIAALVSGGVDSSVALQLLKEQGHTLTAFYLKIWLEDELSYLGNCPWEEDLAFVHQVCQQADVPLEVISLQKEYHEKVVAETIHQVKAGLTPNPDIMCNQRVKFGAFYEKIDTSFQVIATGHYAQTEIINGIAHLKVSPDPIKDQTYFLSHLTQTQLSRVHFPIGHLYKHEVRQLAEKFDLPNKARKDSQGICFLGKIKFDEFIRHHLGTKKGALIEFETGKRVGTHEGYWYYTIGQRKGLGLSGGPWYVVSKECENNTVFISRQYYSSEKERNTFTVVNCSWISGTPPNSGDLRVKVRHGETYHEGSVDILDAHVARVTINVHDQGIAQGQYAAFYNGNYCLGSGVIFNAPL